MGFSFDFESSEDADPVDGFSLVNSIGREFLTLLGFDSDQLIGSVPVVDLRAACAEQVNLRKADNGRERAVEQLPGRARMITSSRAPGELQNYAAVLMEFCQEAGASGACSVYWG